MLPACRLCSLAFGQAQEKVLWSFGSIPNDGNDPLGSLIADSAGNLYGTTSLGGTIGGGTVFELSPQSDGTWTETILYNFCATGTNCFDGYFPKAGLVMDAAGNLYGTTWSGGPQTGCGYPSGCGTVFEVSPVGDGTWTETVLYSFCSTSTASRPCTDGAYPYSQLIFDEAGNLYGTTQQGGDGRSNTPGGTVFELSPGSNGWTETVLYSFCSTGSGRFCTDGEEPLAGVTFNTSGSLFGTAGGGLGVVGVVYELSPSNAGWSERVLVNFYQNGNSSSAVSFDSVGNLYGTTQNNGFQLNKARQTMRTKTFNSTTGYTSEAGILIDPLRNALFGTATQGGANSFGTIWEVTPSRELVPIYSFCAQSGCADGQSPSAGLIEDVSGNLYSITQKGGAYGKGVVFEVTP